MDDELKTTLRSRAMMQRLRQRLVEDAQRLGEDVAQLTIVAQRLDRDAGRLGGQTAAMNDRLAALPTGRQAASGGAIRPSPSRPAAGPTVRAPAP